ncbi:thioredoxin-like protein [Clavulina sp. PMI_390]|nr:thioredoxin-like protein [Clavulina sp. PMI_390]
MITVHHLNNSRSQRVLFLLEELGVPYEIKYYERTPDERAPPELYKVHPFGKVPLITDGDRTLVESGAIVEYLLRHYDTAHKFEPTEEEDIITNSYFTHFAEGSMMGHLVFKYILTLVPNHTPWLVRPLIRYLMDSICAAAVDESIQKEIVMVEEHLSKIPPQSGFIGKPGVLTSADFMMIFALEAARKLTPQYTQDKVHINRWVDWIHSMPTFRKGLEKGGPYSYL